MMVRLRSALIEKYDFGVLQFEGKEYRRDVIIYPDPAGSASGGAGGSGPTGGAATRVDASWWRKEGHRLDKADLEAVVRAKPEVLVVGTGYHGCMEVPKETMEFLRSVGIELIAEQTAQACRKYNELKDVRKVVAALHLTC
ncbi:MAG: Mth938-like domain-containing protein [Terriglobia bacterium]